MTKQQSKVNIWKKDPLVLFTNNLTHLNMANLLQDSVGAIWSDLIDS